MRNRLINSGPENITTFAHNIIESPQDQQRNHDPSNDRLRVWFIYEKIRWDSINPHFLTKLKEYFTLRIYKDAPNTFSTRSTSEQAINIHLYMTRSWGISHPMALFFLSFLGTLILPGQRTKILLYIIINMLK